MEELVFYRVGLDKQVWKNINIIQINNLSYLLNLSNVSISGGQIYKRSVKTNTGYKRVGKIRINDEIFNFEFGVVATKGDINKLVNYEKLEFNPSSILNQGINFNPVASSNELIEVIKIVTNRLNDRYGIIVDFNNAKIRKCEININIPLNYKMQKYEIPFNFLLHKILPKTKKKLPFYDNNLFNGIYCGNSLLEIKFYEKNKECNMNLRNDTLRIEYKTLDEDKTTEMIGTNAVKDILGNFKIIEDSFYKSFENDIYSRLEKTFQKLVKENLKIFNSFRNEFQQFSSYLSSIDVNSTFDYDVVKKMIDETKFKKNYKYNMKKIAYRKLNEKQTQMIGNLELLNEILIKLNYNPIKL